MAAPVRPDTIDEMVYQLWYAVVGSNGDGIAAQVRATRADVADVAGRVLKVENTLPTLWTRKDHECADEERRQGAERRKMTRREKAMLVATFIGSFSALGAVVVTMVVR